MDVYRIQDQRHARNTRCPLSGKAVTGGAWRVFRGAREQIASEAAATVAPTLFDLLQRMKPGTERERQFLAIIESRVVANTLCPRTSRPIERRPLEIGYVGDGRLIGVAGGEDEAPTLAAALHEFYGTIPAPRPEPEEKPAISEPVDDNVAELKRQANEHLVCAFGPVAANHLILGLEQFLRWHDAARFEFTPAPDQLDTLLPHGAACPRAEASGEDRLDLPRRKGPTPMRNRT